MSSKQLTVDSLNPRVREMQYAVRGKIVIRADEINHELSEGTGARVRAFDSVVATNVGNPQSVGQVPLTFPREVLALCELAPLWESRPELLSGFTPDAIARARELMAYNPHGTGAYSNSKGVEGVRRNVAAFLQERDGHAADANNIYLINGASEGITFLMTMLIRSQQDGIMIPIPQYPIYSALCSLLGGQKVGYYLDEDKDKGWTLNVDEMKRALNEARGRGVEVRALAVINPGNPTGNVVGEPEMREIVELCKRERLVLLADEVYQENVYAAGKKFTSFKKVVRDMGPSYDGVELVSFHSLSKGFLGECGHRGGYMEMCGLDPAVLDQAYKMASARLCPNVPGQLLVDVMVRPPRQGDPSHARYAEERGGILAALKSKAEALAEVLNTLEGVTCAPPEGAMYAFPSITLPAKAVAAAEQQGVAPDFLYCMELLEETGLCVVPGSGFLQRDGTWHYRTTFLPPPAMMIPALDRLRAFHASFLARYGGI